MLYTVEFPDGEKKWRVAITYANSVEELEAWVQESLNHWLPMRGLQRASIIVTPRPYGYTLRGRFYPAKEKKLPASRQTEDLP
jgi:hypothetical protein